MTVVLHRRSGQIEHETSQFFSGRARKTEIANLQKSGVINFAQYLGHSQRRVTVLPQKMHECISRYEIGLKRFESLGRQLVRLSRKRTSQAYDLPSLSNADDNGFPVSRIRRELNPAIAKDKYPARILPFDEQDGLF